MKTLILLMVIATASMANAANCFKHPKKCAKSADRRARQARDVAVDIVTAGHTKRERERNEADKKREQAEQAKKFAEETLANNIKTKQIEISNIDQQLLFMDFMEQSITTVKEYATAISPLLEQLYSAYQTDQLRAQHIHELIKLQNDSFTSLINYKFVSRDPETNKVLQDKKELLQIEIEKYKAQISSFPISNSNAEDVEAWLTGTEEKSYEVLIYCNQTLVWLQAEREKLANEKLVAQKELSLLKGEDTKKVRRVLDCDKVRNNTLRKIDSKQIRKFRRKMGL